MTESPKHAPTRHAMPFTRVEIAVMSLIDGSLHVLLAKRAQAPYAGRWALPGGAVRIDLDGSLDATAQRVMSERLGVKLPFLRQLSTVGGPTRDPRAPWAVSILYRALVPAEGVKLVAGKRIEALEWRAVDEVVTDTKLAFDHAALVVQAVAATRAEIYSLDLPFGFLPDEFTLGELQMACEQLLGRRLDKSSFRRRLADRDLLEAIDGAMRIGAFRPAQLYKRKDA
ncbi:MAG: NUDIX domain-containing protein [Micropepsaceae bacterium]